MPCNWSFTFTNGWNTQNVRRVSDWEVNWNWVQLWGSEWVIELTFFDIVGLIATETTYTRLRALLCMRHKPRPLSWPQASRLVSNSYMLSIKHHSRTSYFNIFCFMQPGIKPPASCTPRKSSSHYTTRLYVIRRTWNSELKIGNKPNDARMTLSTSLLKVTCIQCTYWWGLDFWSLALNAFTMSLNTSRLKVPSIYKYLH